MCKGKIYFWQNKMFPKIYSSIVPILQCEKGQTIIFCKIERDADPHVSYNSQFLTFNS